MLGARGGGASPGGGGAAMRPPEAAAAACSAPRDAAPAPLSPPPPPPAGAPPTPERPGGILRRGRRAAAPRQVRFLLAPEVPRGPPGWGEEAPAAPPAAPPPVLAAPRLHSSRALGAGARAAAREPFDAPRAAAELLATSFAARCALGAGAAAAMNIPPEQQLFRGLVSLAVPAEQVLTAALRERLALAPPRPETRRDPELPGPDLLVFLEPSELVTERPYLAPEPPAATGAPRPCARPPGATFLMYRKLRQWEP